MKGKCIICKEKPGNPNFCKQCIRKSWEERLKAVENTKNITGRGRTGRTKLYSKFVRDKLGLDEG